jgi:glucokinase
VSTPRIGVDVGGTKILALLLDVDAPDAPIASKRLPTPGTSEEVIEAIIEAVRFLDAPGPVGLGLPGLVDSDGVLRGAPNLPCLVDIELREPLERALGVRVSIDNDSTCALRAEMAVGVARGVDDVVLVTLGTGIGGGVAIGGEVRRGAHGFAGEPGHMLVDPDGPLCVCGRRGCWERYASATGLVRMANESASFADARGAITSERLVADARAGDPAALAIWDTFAGWLANGLANLADVLDPELLVIGGGLVDVADLFLEVTRERFLDDTVGGRARVRTRIEPAALGHESGAVGASLLR